MHCGNTRLITQLVIHKHQNFTCRYLIRLEPAADLPGRAGRGSPAGAEAPGISQPTAGAIADLEAQLGRAVRAHRPRLAAHGAARWSCRSPRAMQSDALALAERLLDTQGQQAAPCAWSASQPVACYLLPDILARLRQALPAIQIELVVSNLVSNLLRSEPTSRCAWQPAQSSLVVKRIAEVTLSVCASTGVPGTVWRRPSPPTCCGTS